MGLIDHVGKTGDGANWEVHDSLLDLRLPEWRSRQLVELLSDRIRRTARQEKSTPDDFKIVHRMAKMCYELLTENQITTIDRTDSDILYSLPLDDKTFWLNSILNPIRFELKITDGSIIMADHMTKSIEIVMTS